MGTLDSIPHLKAFMDTQPVQRQERFRVALEAFDSAVVNRQMWNVDYVDHKYRLNQIAEDAIESAAEGFRAPRRGVNSGNYPQWDSGDPRWNAIYAPQFSNTPGAAKKLQKYRGKEGVGFDEYVDMLDDVAKVALLVKSVKPFIQKGRKPSEHPVEVEYTNPGICPICGKRQKLNKDRLVAHGKLSALVII